MTPSAQSRPRSRFWKWLLRGLLGLSILTTALALLGWLHYAKTAAQGKALLESAVSELDARDPDWRWEALEAKRPQIEDSKNSIKVVQEMARLLGTDKPNDLRLENGEELFELNRPPNRLLEDERIKLIRDYLAGRQKAVDLAASLRQFSNGRAEITLEPMVMNTLMPHLNDCRTAFELLRLDFERQMVEQHFEIALSHIHALLNLSAALRDEPFLISQLVRIRGRALAVRWAERLLAMTTLSDADLKRLADWFDGELNVNSFASGLRGERAGFHIMLTNLQDGRFELDDLLDPALAKLGQPSLSVRLISKYYRSRLYEDHAVYLERISQAIEIADRPFVEQPDALEQFQAETVKTRKAAESEFRFIMSVFLMPDVKKVGVSAIRDRAHISCMTAAIATERFRLKFNRWPVELDELCPQYLAQVPIDPFDGTPLKSSKNEDGFVIYSVGADRVDNGGEQVWARDERSREPSDVGVQLFNPDRRRLPPEPKKGGDPDNY